MRQLTIVGYLRKYVKELSINETTNLFKLSSELSRNPRLKAPLFIFVLLTDKQDVLIPFLKNATELKELINKYNKNSLLIALKDPDSELKEEYKKVWRSYYAKKNMHKTDNQTKELILQKVIEIKVIKQISNYKIYTDLDLNHGNINAWLKSGESNKVSLDTARKVLKYIQELPMLNYKLK